jgi:inhibitor of cysteine peptidase
MKPTLKAVSRRRGAADRTPVLFVAIVLVLAAAIGFVPMLTGNNTLPSASSSSFNAQSGPLRSFQNLSQLQDFMAANAKSAQEYDAYGGSSFIGGPIMFAPGITMTATMESSASMGVAGTLTTDNSAASSASSPSFTGTNVQVQGVDEPDIVKTDGTHLFVASAGPGSSTGGSSVTIIQAYPPTSNAVLSKVSLSGQVIGIEIAQGRLMVIDQGYTNGTTSIGLLLYNTSILSSPKLIGNVTVAGTYVAARMAQGYLYAIVQQPSYSFNGQGNATEEMPYLTVNGQRTALPPSSILYTPNNSQIGDYTMIVSVSMASGAETTVSVLTGPSSTVYVSTSNIYVVYSDYMLFANADDIPGNVFTGGVLITSSSVQQDQNSTIFRASYSSNGNVVVQAVGTVPGSVLNQFSMDEYNGYFRVATSRLATINGNATESDDVYVLNQNMSQVSALRNIAPGENLYAVRFSGDMGYVVTFEQVDPLFAISFADIAHPVILSALKVNGYSDYLQPLFGSSYLLGVGKDTVASSTGNFAYYLGLKLSLFHVAANGSSSDVSDYMIGDRGTDSPVLTDHLALTYDPANNITVIPVLLAEVPASQQSSGTSQSPPPEGNPVWQGAYVFRVNATGFTLLGTVSQYPAGQNYGDSPNSNLQIDRSVIIGDYLYTISQGEVMVSSLSSLATIATLPL